MFKSFGIYHKYKIEVITITITITISKMQVSTQNEDINIYCQVQHCRFPKSHLTCAHKCGKCSQLGHGQMECGDSLKITLLQNKIYVTKIVDGQTVYYDVAKRLPIYFQCTISRCASKHTHMRESHHCETCKRKDHSKHDCIILPIENSRFANKYSDIPQLLQNYNNIYIQDYVGMGCANIIRKRNNNIKVLFMHNDSWGQYGPHTDNTPIYNAFIEHLTDMGTLGTIAAVRGPPSPVAAGPQVGLSSPNDPDPITGDLPLRSHHMNNNKIKCPLCRTINTIDEISSVKGLSEKCCVCLDNNVTHYFPACEHACVCTTCYTQLDKT